MYYSFLSLQLYMSTYNVNFTYLSFGRHGYMEDTKKKKKKKMLDFWYNSKAGTEANHDVVHMD
jgi:hypothetical protein